MAPRAAAASKRSKDLQPPLETVTQPMRDRVSEMMCGVCGDYGMEVERLLFETNDAVGYRRAVMWVWPVLSKHSAAVKKALDPGQLASSTAFDVMRLLESPEQSRQASDQEAFLKRLFATDDDVEQIRNNLAPVVACRACGSSNVLVEMKQTRSADEGSKAFVSCRKCENKWVM